jgi:hypothetical protein
MRGVRYIWHTHTHTHDVSKLFLSTPIHNLFLLSLSDRDLYCFQVWERSANEKTWGDTHWCLILDNESTWTSETSAITDSPIRRHIPKDGSPQLALLWEPQTSYTRPLRTERSPVQRNGLQGVVNTGWGWGAEGQNMGVGKKKGHQRKTHPPPPATNKFP